MMSSVVYGDLVDFRGTKASRGIREIGGFRVIRDFKERLGLQTVIRRLLFNVAALTIL